MKDKIKYHQDQPEEIRKPSSSSQNDRPKFTGSSHITLESLLPALRQAKETLNAYSKQTKKRR